MRIRPPMTVALATAALLVAGGVAFAAVQSVGTEPDPQVVIPTSASVTPTSSHESTSRGADDPATHDAGDDNGGTTSGSGSDDPAPAPTATADDNGGSGGSGSGSGSGGGGSDDSGGSGGGHGSDG
jgi:hypothetical protein